MEPPEPSLADELNVPQKDAVLVFDVRRAAVSLPFQVYRHKVLVEAGLVAFSSACFEFADEAVGHLFIYFILFFCEEKFQFV